MKQDRQRHGRYASKDDGGSALARNSFVRPNVVANKFACRVKVRVTPEIRAIDVMRAISSRERLDPARARHRVYHEALMSLAQRRRPHKL